jgi:uncharacterized protein
METEITVLNECSLDHVEHDYLPIVEEAAAAYRRNLDKLLLAIRLAGSVPRGEATHGSSDINFVALLSTNPVADQRNALLAESKRLTAKHPCVSRVALETDIKGRIPAFREFVLRSDSICVWGNDTYPAAETRLSI